MRFLLAAVIYQCVLSVSNNGKVRLVTDAGTEPSVHKSDGFMKRNGTDFILLGDGNCINHVQRIIDTTQTFHRISVDPVTREAKECSKFCVDSPNCAGYVIVEESECSIIFVNNRNYGDGIFAGDGKPGLKCFRKAGVPVAPHHRSGWAFWGRLSVVVILLGVIGGLAYLAYASIISHLA